MVSIVSYTGANKNVHRSSIWPLLTALLSALVLLASGCGGGPSVGPGGVDMNEAAATVNGKPIKMEDVERAVKQQAQGQSRQECKRTRHS